MINIDIVISKDKMIGEMNLLQKIYLIMTVIKSRLRLVHSTTKLSIFWFEVFVTINFVQI